MTGFGRGLRAPSVTKHLKNKIIIIWVILGQNLIDSGSVVSFVSVKGSSMVEVGEMLHFSV